MTNPDNNRPDGQDNTVRVDRALLERAMDTIRYHAAGAHEQGYYDIGNEAYELARCLDAALNAEPESPWRDIEEAPIGVDVWVETDSGSMFCAGYYDGRWRTPDPHGGGSYTISDGEPVRFMLIIPPPPAIPKENER